MNPSALAVLFLAACAAAPPAAPRELVLYPPAPDLPRLQFLRSISDGNEVELRQISALDRMLFGEQDVPPKPIPRPSGIAVREGVFYVTDTELGALVSIDLTQRRVDMPQLDGRARLVSPLGICFGPDGKVYVADRGRRQVVVLDRDFHWETEFGPWSDDTGPTDVTIWRDRLYVADSGAHCVRVLALADGKELQVLGTAQRMEEYLRGPSSVAVDANGFVYVVDTVFSRIYVWDPDGKFVRHIGTPGDRPGYLARPKGICCYGRTLWVLDAAFDNCQIFDFDGNALLFFGGPGASPGAMSLPRKVLVTRESLDAFKDWVDPDFDVEAVVVVSNADGPRLNFYAFGKSRKFKYPDAKLPERPTTPPPEPEQPAVEPKK